MRLAAREGRVMQLVICEIKLGNSFGTLNYLTRSTIYRSENLSSKVDADHTEGNYIAAAGHTRFDS